MVDLKILEEFMVKYTNSEASEGIHKVFMGFTEDPARNLASGFNNICPYTTHQDINVRSSAVNGMLLGMFLARASEDQELRRFFLEGFIEAVKKDKNENVYTLLDYKIKKGIK